jgi:hypothetical protein
VGTGIGEHRLFAERTGWAFAGHMSGSRERRPRPGPNEWLLFRPDVEAILEAAS